MLQVTYKAIHTLTPYENNSRTHSEDQIQQIVDSIQEFGFTVPVSIDENDGVIAGHGRIDAAKIVGMTEIPTIMLEGLSEAQRAAYVIADNKLALNAGWDVTRRNLEINRLNALNFNVGVLGFEVSELKSILQPQGLTDEDSVPELPEDPVARRGDVWALGNHRLMCGDSTSTDDVETLTEGQLVDQLITDPPYNVDYVGKTADKLTIQNDSMSDSEFRRFLTDAFTAADAVMKQGAAFYIWHADTEGYNFRGACRDSGWTVRQCLIWNKNSMVMGRQDYHWKHEPCLYGWKDGAGHLWATDRKQVTILEFDKPAANRLHPTMKPVSLLEYQVKNNTKGSDIVLDLFGGSGSTLMACEKTGRNCRMMELDPKYCDVIVNRWQDYTGKEAILESNEER